MKYRYLDHTADAKFQAFGKTLEEAFTNSALAMANILHDPATIQVKIKKNINIRSKKSESLLYDFLEELLFLLDTEGFLLHNVNDLKIKKSNDGYSLQGIAVGDNHSSYELNGNIKSITYSEMFIKKENDRYIIQVVVDI